MILLFFLGPLDVVEPVARYHWSVLHRYSFSLNLKERKQSTYILSPARLPAGRQVCQFRHRGKISAE